MKIRTTMVMAMFGAATVLTACDTDAQSQAETYCVTPDGTVVDDDFCEVGEAEYDGTYLLWTDSDGTKYKKGKKIPSADFRKGQTSTPSSTPKTSTGKSSSAPKSSAKSSAPKASQPKASAPKPATPKAKTGK